MGRFTSSRPAALANPGGVAVARDGDQEVVVVADLFGNDVFDAATGALRKRLRLPGDGHYRPLTVSAPSTGGVVVSSWLFQFGRASVAGMGPGQGRVRLRQAA